MAEKWEKVRKIELKVQQILLDLRKLQEELRDPEDMKENGHSSSATT